MESLTQTFVDLLFQPGSSLKLIPIINATILFLLILLIVLAYYNIATIHVIILGSLSILLLISVNWFYSEFQKIKALDDKNKSK